MSFGRAVKPGAPPSKIDGDQLEKGLGLRASNDEQYKKEADPDHRRGDRFPDEAFRLRSSLSRTWNTMPPVTELASDNSTSTSWAKR